MDDHPQTADSSDEQQVRARLQVSERRGDRRGTSFALRELSRIALQRGDLVTAKASLEQALQDVRLIGDKSNLAVILRELADLSLLMHDLDTAERGYRPRRRPPTTPTADRLP